MAAKKQKTVLGTVVTIVIVAAVIWMKVQEVRDSQKREGTLRDDQVEITQPGDTGVADPGAESLLSVASYAGTRYQIYRDCKLIDSRRNDGDSFYVQTEDGKKELRLYFVDAPESAAREYGDGDTNHKRIADQGRSLGGLDQHQTTQVGVEAKLFTKKLLSRNKFTVVTRGENVYNSHRIYAFVLVEVDGENRYLHELLTLRGLARIHTKPMTLPDNTSASRQREQLKTIEQYARSKKYGAWGVK